MWDDAGLGSAATLSLSMPTVGTFTSTLRNSGLQISGLGSIWFVTSASPLPTTPRFKPTIRVDTHIKCGFIKSTKNAIFWSNWGNCYALKLSFSFILVDAIGANAQVKIFEQFFKKLKNWSKIRIFSKENVDFGTKISEYLAFLSQKIFFKKFSWDPGWLF